jgi:ribosomal subunit interface protein
MNTMDSLLRITFHGLERSEAVEASVREHAAKLLTFDSRIVSCDVAVEAPHRSKQHGRHYRVRVHLVVPWASLVANRNPDEGKGDEDVYAAIDDAFSRAARVLHDHLAKSRHHSSAPGEP